MKRLFVLLGTLAFTVGANASLILSDFLPFTPGLADTGDELFSVSDIDGVDDDITSFILGRSASFSNAFGIYDPLDITNVLQVSDGIAPAGFASGEVLEFNNATQSYQLAGTVGTYSTTAANSVFGLYIDTGFDRFYSQADLNADGLDHLLTFATEGQGGLTNAFDYVFAWEDAFGGGDMDYNDIITGCIDCTAARAVPEPAPVFLMGLGLMAMGVAARRKQS